MNFKKLDITYNFTYNDINKECALNVYEYIVFNLLDQCNLYDIDLVVLDSCCFNADENNIIISVAYDYNHDNTRTYLLSYIIESIYNNNPILNYCGKYKMATSDISTLTLRKHKMYGSKRILDFFDINIVPVENIYIHSEPIIRSTYNSKVINNRKVIIL